LEWHVLIFFNYVDSVIHSCGEIENSIFCIVYSAGGFVRVVGGEAAPLES
jgi:hypothetical protein